MKRFIDEFVYFGPGEACFPSNIHIEYYQPLKKQTGILREDMLWVNYGSDADNYTIDVGWYGTSFSIHGFFRVCLIKNEDWSMPALSIRCKSIKKLVPAIEKCLNRLKAETDDFRLLSPTSIVE